MKCVVKNNSSMDMGPLLPLLKSLLPYTRKKLGFNRPPSLFFASDTENASKPLGKTAFYDPSEASITIFVDGRHPKDILRSISHELVHHMQHERGDFGTGMDTGEGYAQKNDALRELEREAYESGNMCFRDWEDENRQALQEAKQHFDRKNKKMSANDKRNDKIESLLMEKWGFKAKVSDVGLIQEKDAGFWDKAIVGASAVTDFAAGAIGLDTDYADDYIKKITPPKEIEEPGPDLEALRATQAYKDTMQGKQGAIDPTALSDMTPEARTERSTMIGRGIDISPDAAPYVNTVDTVSALLDRGDLISRKLAVNALLSNTEFSGGLEASGDSRDDIQYVANAKDTEGNYIFNTVDDFRALTLPDIEKMDPESNKMVMVMDPAKQELITKITDIREKASNDSQSAAEVIMSDIYGLTMTGESLDVLSQHRGIFNPGGPIPNNLFGIGEPNPQAVAVRKGMEKIDADMKRGYTCPDGGAVCGPDEQKNFGVTQREEAIVALATATRGPNLYGGGASLPHVVGSHEIDEWGLDLGANTAFNANARKGIYGLNPMPGERSAGVMKARAQHQDGKNARFLLARNWRANLELALTGLEDGSLEHEQAKNNFEKNNTFESFMQDYNRKIKQQRENGSQGVLGEKAFAAALGKDIRNGYKLNRFGIIDPDQSDKISPGNAGSSFHELLSTDFGKGTLMPPDFSRESQLWYDYAQKTFNQDVRTPEDLEVWKAKMIDDRRPQNNKLNVRDIGGRWSNTAMQRRNRLYVAKAVFLARSKDEKSAIKVFGADQRHGEPKDGYGKPEGRREDDITREALIRKVVQEALKRKFGE